MIAKVQFAPTRMTRTFAALLGGQIAARSIRIVYVIALARLIEPSQFGLYLYGVAVCVALLGLAGFGQSLFLATRLPHRLANRAWIAHSLTIRLAATATAALAGLVYVWVQESDPLYQVTVGLLLGALIARSLASWVRETYVALEDAAWIPRYEMGFRATEAVIGVALAANGVSIVWLAALHSAVWAIEAATSIRRMRHRGLWPARPGGERRLLGPIVAASFWYMASAGFIIVFGQVGILGLRHFNASADLVGQFAIAVQGLLALVLVPSTLAAALVAALSRVRRQGVSEDQSAVTTLLRWTLAAGAGLAVLVEGYGAPAVTYLLGARYAEAAGLFTTLAWAAGPLAAAIISVQSLNGMNRNRQAAVAAAVMIAVQAAALAVLYPKAGLEGAAVATIIGAVAGCVAGAAMIGASSQLRGVSWWLVPLMMTGGAAAAMRLAPVNAPILAPIVLVLLFAALAAVRVVVREELAYVARRFGGRPSPM